MAAPLPSPHKPRRKAKRVGNGASNLSTTESGPLVRTPSFPLAGFLWPARGVASEWELLPLILMVVGLFRWAAGLWSYSGALSVPSTLLTLRWTNARVRF
jgi:alpha-1,3-glucosyltransferase